jgi:hypothetical protein
VQETIRKRMGVMVHVATAHIMYPASNMQRGAWHTPRTHVYITVPHISQANVIVNNRRQLKGSGFVIADELSTAEREAYQLMWPRHMEARKAGKNSYFTRAELRIDGKLCRVEDDKRPSAPAAVAKAC